MGTSERTPSRRTFMKTGAAAIAGATAALNGEPVTGAETTKRRTVPGTPGKKIVGCYCSPKEILEEPKYMDALQERLGVNIVICRSDIAMPQWLKDMNPLEGNGWMGAIPA